MAVLMMVLWRIDGESMIEKTSRVPCAQHAFVESLMAVARRSIVLVASDVDPAWIVIERCRSILSTIPTAMRLVMGGVFAALPPHIAVRLCLTGHFLTMGGCASMASRHSPDAGIKTANGKAQSSTPAGLPGWGPRPFRTVRRRSRKRVRKVSI